MKQTVVYRDGKIKTLKADLTDEQVKGYFERHPNAVICTAIPSMSTLERWVSNGSCKAIDGCAGIEPDGHCEHGRPSWLLALNCI